ncbi:hypothetical protein GUJ93_ZPchr0006g46320 [Zizania palustris]|uniref:Uncharacterized protein n=1 Tax=Zizania palustris TaxID=103762 RepID=A0A8J5SYL3_ZIZPA|nr:hypothetical protein GUJ93_ZPchr0006g46320 [Zizania palustris]
MGGLEVVVVYALDLVAPVEAVTDDHSGLDLDPLLPHQVLPVLDHRHQVLDSPYEFLGSKSSGAGARLHAREMWSSDSEQELASGSLAAATTTITSTSSYSSPPLPQQRRQRWRRQRERRREQRRRSGKRLRWLWRGG